MSEIAPVMLSSKKANEISVVFSFYVEFMLPNYFADASKVKPSLFIDIQLYHRSTIPGNTEFITQYSLFLILSFICQCILQLPLLFHLPFSKAIFAA